MTSSKVQNAQTVLTHVIIAFVTTFAGVLTTAKLGANISAWESLISAAAIAGVTSVTAYLTGLLNLVAPTVKTSPSTPVVTSATPDVPAIPVAPVTPIIHAASVVAK